MSSKALLTSKLMNEFGKDSPDVRNRVDMAISEVVVDLLNQNQSRFRKLGKTEDLTLTPSDTRLKLPSNFKTVNDPFIQVDSDENFLNEVEVVTEREFYRRKGDSNYGGTNYAYIKYNAQGASGAGDYLIFDLAPSVTRYYKFFYFRFPDENDADFIENESIVKDGVRAQFPEFVPDSLMYAQKYEGKKARFKENPETRSTIDIMKPSKMQQRRNRKMHSIARGE